MTERITNKDHAKRVKTKRLLLIAFLSLFLIPYSYISAKKPQQPTPLTTEQEQQFRYYWYGAKQAIEEKRYQDALVLLEFCHALNPQDGTTLYQLGVFHQGMGHADQARAYFEQAYTVQPKGTANEDLLEQLKRIYISDGEWKKALAILDEIDQRAGYDAFSALTRYRIYAMWGKKKKAIEAIDQYLERDPSNLRFLLFRLELMEQTGAKQKELYNLYEKILEVDPYNLMVLNNYAYHLATHGGELKKAERMSEITIRQEPDNPVYLDTYGWIMHLQGQEELALFYLRKALWNSNEKNRQEIEKHLKEIEH